MSQYPCRNNLNSYTPIVFKGESHLLMFAALHLVISANYFGRKFDNKHFSYIFLVLLDIFNRA